MKTKVILPVGIVALVVIAGAVFAFMGMPMQGAEKKVDTSIGGSSPAIIGSSDSLTEDSGEMMESESMESMEESEHSMEESMTEGEAMEESGEAMMESSEEESTVLEGYKGQLIAGSLEDVPYLRFNQADFDKAQSEGKAVYLYYYATWCSICAAERPGIFSAIDNLDRDDVVGFEVHFNDGQNNNEDNDIAREFGVFSQHTHVFIDKEGNLVEKTLNPLTEDAIQEKILATV